MILRTSENIATATTIMTSEDARIAAGEKDNMIRPSTRFGSKKCKDFVFCFLLKQFFTIGKTTNGGEQASPFSKMIVLNKYLD